MAGVMRVETKAVMKTGPKAGARPAKNPGKPMATLRRGKNPAGVTAGSRQNRDMNRASPRRSPGSRMPAASSRGRRGLHPRPALKPRLEPQPTSQPIPHLPAFLLRPVRGKA